MILYKSKCLQFLEAWHKSLTHHSMEAASREKGTYSHNKHALMHGFTTQPMQRVVRLFCQRQIRPHERECLFYKAGTENLFHITHFPKHNRAPLSLPHFWTIHQQISERSQRSVNRLCLIGSGSKAAQPAYETFGPQQESMQRGPKE